MKIKVLFLGTPTIAVSALKSLNESDNFEVVGVVTNEDKFFGRSRSTPKPSPVKEYAVENNLNLIQTDALNKEVDKINNIEHDYMITCAFGQFLNEEVLSLPKKKPINIHASLLPEGRGGAPIHWAIINGKKETGISYMDMVKEMDAGDYYQQYKISIDEDDNLDIVYSKLSSLIEKTAATAIKEIDEGYPPTKQDESKVTKWLNVTKEDRIINFNKPATNVHNQIRGLTSWPGAITFLDSEIVKINQTNLDYNDQVMAQQFEPGKVIDVLENEILIMCNPGIIAVTNLTMPGKKPMDVSQLTKGNFKITKDTIFKNE